MKEREINKIKIEAETKMRKTGKPIKPKIESVSAPAFISVFSFLLFGS